jgi:hypothetical protein
VPRQVALETADRLAHALALGSPALDVSDRRRVVLAPRDDDRMQRAVRAGARPAPASSPGQIPGKTPRGSVRSRVTDEEHRQQPGAPQTEPPALSQSGLAQLTRGRLDLQPRVSGFFGSVGGRASPQTAQSEPQPVDPATVRRGRSVVQQETFSAPRDHDPRCATSFRRHAPGYGAIA